MKRVIFLVVFTTIVNFNFPQSMVVQKNDGSNLFIDLTTIDKINFIIPCPGTPTVDYSGKTYNTLQIGTQCWLKENLDVGTMVTGGQSNNGVIEKYCYNNDPNNCTTYGGLYLWNEAMQYETNEGARGVCPTGWHMPTFAEYQTLVATLDSNSNALKAIGQGSGAGAGTNTSGFSALLAGAKGYSGGPYQGLGEWSSFYVGKNGACGTYTCVYSLGITSNSGTIILGEGAMPSWGLSVRCIKD